MIATFSSGPYFLESVAQPHVITDDFTAIMAEFPTITQPCSKDRPIKDDITHYNDTTGPHISARSRRLATEKLKIARQDFDHMLELGCGKGVDN